MHLLVDILFASVKCLPVCTLRVLPEDSLKNVSIISLCNINWKFVHNCHQRRASVEMSLDSCTVQCCAIVLSGCLSKELCYLLTPRCRVLLEKLTGLQLVKKFPAFHGTRRFITALTSVRHLSLSWASPIQRRLQSYLLTYLLHGTESFLRS